MADKKYYEAYDDRYRQVHSRNLQWFHNMPSPIVEDVIRRYHLSRNHRMLEIGCGEGRDAVPILKQGFELLATDVSREAISFCQEILPEMKHQFRLLDCIAHELQEAYDFIYAVAVVHMLVLDADRDAFYGFIREHLNSGGIALFCTMGDGKEEFRSDIHSAFDLQPRMHSPTGTLLTVAGTSCRVVSFPTFSAELYRNGLEILEQGITCVEPDFPQMMYAVVKSH